MTSPFPLDARTPGSLSRHLPSGCAVRRAMPGDAERVTALLRDADREEMEALEGRPALAVLQAWMNGGSRVLLTHGDAMAIFGITACIVHSSNPGPQHQEDDAQRAATPWVAMVSTLDHDNLVHLLWLSRFQVDAWQRRWPVLLTVRDARNHFRGQWLDWLGFERRGRVDHFGAAGIPFDLHVRLHGLPLSPPGCWPQ